MIPVRMIKRVGNLFEVQLESRDSFLEVLNDIGHMPLPPYIKRDDEDADKLCYQTVYADEPGAVAAPTAGLHFDQGILDRLKEKGVNQAFVTLHVGAGTFNPVRVDDITGHSMHSEWLHVSQSVCDMVKDTKRRGKRVIAVGTTSVRCLETACGGHINAYGGDTDRPVATEGLVMEPFQGETDIFIRPSYRFKCVDALVTNFHLPESTLLMLVSAFAGHKHTMEAYKEAIADKYRFFSYGDANFITRNPSS